MILVTDGQMRHSLAVVRSLGRKGLKVMVGDSEMISTSFFSRYASKRIVYPDPVKKEKEFLAFLLNLVQKEKIEMIIPITDACLIPLAKHREEFEKYTKLPLINYDLIMKARDKAQTIKIAEEIGIPVPKTYYPETLQGIQQVKEYPVIIKPRMSSGSRGFALCNNYEELKNNFEMILKEYPQGLLVQEYIPKKDEIGFYALLNQRSELKAFTVQKRIRSYPLNGGPSTLRETIRHDYVKDLSLKLLKSINWQGLAMVEFRVDARDGTPKLMEINPRFWGSLALSIAAGVDFPYLLYRLAKDGDIEEHLNYKVGVKCRWLFPGDILWFLSAKKSWKNLKDFLNFKIKDDIIEIADTLPIFGSILASFIYLLSREKRKYVFRR